MQPGDGLRKEEIRELLKQLGKYLGFDAIRESFLLPIVGFEIEEKTYVRKMIRGDIDSLNSLAPQVGCIILSRRIATVTRYNEEHRNRDEKEAMEIAKKRWDTDLETFKRYAEANPFYRIVVITDEDVMRICEKLKDKITKKRAERDLKIYDLPDDLVCPACSVGKEVFEKVE